MISSGCSKEVAVKSIGISQELPIIIEADQMRGLVGLEERIRGEEPSKVISRRPSQEAGAMFQIDHMMCIKVEER